jgi:hypothetical protein
MKTIRISAFLLGGMMLAAAFAYAATPTYVGSKRCKACHLREYRSWEKTRMARTFDLLRPGTAVEAKRKATMDLQKDYTHEPKCLACHVTGSGKPGGFVSFEKTPEMAGVQCEECHGPGSEYLKAGGMTFQNKHYKRADLVKLGLVVPNQGTCASVCHNERSPFRGPGYVFAFEEREAKGVHEIFTLKYKH